MSAGHPAGQERREREDDRRGERPDRIQAEQPGATEHPGADARLLALLAQLDLRELDLEMNKSRGLF